jgi:hypothetical protein
MLLNQKCMNEISNHITIIKKSTVVFEAHCTFYIYNFETTAFNFCEVVV